MMSFSMTPPRSLPWMRSSLVALLVASAGCPDDTPPVDTTTSDTETGTSTTSVGPTTIDPDTTGTTTMMEDTTITGESTSTGPGAECGNGMVEGDEDCDGTDLGDADCESEGFDGGRLACDDGCVFDTSACTINEPVCGNDMIEDPEPCDGTELGGADCMSEGFSGGTLACAKDCSALDTSGCTSAGSNCCINNGMMGCDDAVCEAAICGLDPYCCDTEWDDLCAAAATGVDGNGNECAVCPLPMCGNDVIEFGEACEAADLLGEDCASLGFMGGVLACAADCTAYDTSGCMAGPPSNCCINNGMMGCDNAVCEAAICGLDAYCCDTEWDDICAAAATGVDGEGNECAVCPFPMCGNGTIEFSEVCDTADLAGQDCMTQGFMAGVLACNANCFTFDLSGCMGITCGDADLGGAIGPAVASGDTTLEDNDVDGSCGDTGGNDRALTFTAPSDGFYTFDTVGSMYDTKLSLFAGCTPETELACNDDTVGTTSEVSLLMTAGQTILVVVDGFDGATGAWTLNITLVVFSGDCCAPHLTQGCDDPGCTAAICGVDPFCCNTEWDMVCSDAALAEPLCMGVGGTCP
jgi:hypothetical protein